MQDQPVFVSRIHDILYDSWLWDVRFERFKLQNIGCSKNMV